MYEQISILVDANITNVNSTYTSTPNRCFADTSIISETMREILRHISNKVFFISIGIVTIFYTISFVLALHRQNPRIRALKQSLNVLNKFHAPPSAYRQSRGLSIVSANSALCSTAKVKRTIIESKNTLENEYQQCSMPSTISYDAIEKQELVDEPNNDLAISTSVIPLDDLRMPSEKLRHTKRVSFQNEYSDDMLTNDNKQPLSFLSNSCDTDFAQNTKTYYRIPCPCLTTRQLFIKFHFTQPALNINQLSCCRCIKKSRPSDDHQLSNINSTEDETLPLPNASHRQSSISNSEILKKHLFQYRIKQIRMALTFLLITVSFVLFYLPSILSAERYIKSPLMIYYLYLCTHALNPMIYCFMTQSLREYVFAILKCQRKRKNEIQEVEQQRFLNHKTNT